ncbi:MAG TPA: hypothetical protein VMT91_06900 [Anaerolineales bacterium]|nr:hypothetical protein [Anaerolineales bacterium]
MFTPNSPYEEMESILPEWHEPFPQPQTIPARWDVSEVLAAPATEGKVEIGASADD